MKTVRQSMDANLTPEFMASKRRDSKTRPTRVLPFTPRSSDDLWWLGMAPRHMVGSDNTIQNVRACSMSSEMIAIAADHAGYDLKCALKQRLIDEGFDVVDLGTDDTKSVDYPDFAGALAREIADGRSARGVLLCGSGIGMSIAANRFPGVRAALVHDEEGAQLARQHNDANVLVLGARRIEQSTAEECLKAFMSTPFEGGRHQKRVQKMA